MLTASMTSLGYEDAWKSRIFVVFAHLLGIWLGYILIVVTYRISLWHPLYKFPGPRLARATFLYEMYFDLYQGGQYAHQIRKLHELYGPLVRINPDGLDCSDPYFIDEVYAGGSRKRNKAQLHVNHLLGSMRLSAFGAIDHDMHRRRRDALRRFFSRAAMGRIERDLHGLAQQLGDRMLATGGAAFGVQDAMSCFTSDGIGLHSFGEPLGFLARAAPQKRDGDAGQGQHQGQGQGAAGGEFFVPNLKRSSFPIFTTFFMFRWLDLTRVIFERFGAYLSFILPEDTMIFKNLTDVEVPARIRQVKAEHDAKIVRGRETAFDALLDSDLPEHEKSLDRLSGEAAVFLIAGTDTTSWTLTVATYHLLQLRADFLARLTAELRAAAPDPRELPAQAALEQLPLLGAAVREALRLSYGVSGRSARVAPDEDLAYRGTWRRRCWRPREGKEETMTGEGEGEEKMVEEEVEEVGVAHVIPRGTPVSMSSSILHHDEGVFSDSERFLPERWLDGEGQRRKDLERFLFSFSKGSRSCLGINLAYSELYLAMAVLVLRVYPRLRLYQPSVDDIRFDSDYFVPLIKKGREGLRATVVD